jgi:polysaccharide export outer membrane protein
MKRSAWKKVLVLLVCLTAVVAAEPHRAAAQTSAPMADYVIGPGDVLMISVWKDEALTRQVVVLPDGKVAFPLIGQIAAGGRTVADLSKEFEQKLARYVPDLTLNLSVYQVNSLLVYVIGRVNNPGRFNLNTDVNVLQALSMAGGLNPFAKRGDIKVFREIGGSTQVMNFDYDKVTAGDDLRQNVRLKRGDVVVVP